MSGCMFHYNPILADYAKVIMVEVHPNHLMHDLDFPTEDGLKHLGDANNNFVFEISAT